MKFFKCKDTDGGRKSFVVARDIKKAIDAFMEKNNKIPPEIVEDLTADGETLIIQSESERICNFVENWLIENIMGDSGKISVLRKELENFLNKEEK